VDKKNIKLTLAYDGTSYHGWQRQKNGVTIQAVIEEKIERMVGEPVKLIASGRTDAGVHAINQVCHFVTRSKIGPDVMQRGLNSLLPDDIFVREAAYVPIEFHARYNIKRKTYEYRILNREAPDLFLRHYVWHIRKRLNTMEMKRCFAVIEGMHDFSAFRSAGSGNLDPVRSIFQAGLYGSEDGMLRLVLEADGFLRHMVRNIVGTLVDAGLGKLDVERFKEILESKDRRLAGIKAPPQGLFLMSVEY
jgi:tRNA pseudouridine38-40 synthase